MDSAKGEKLFDEQACFEAMLEAAGNKVTVFNLDLGALGASPITVLLDNVCSAFETSSAELLARIALNDRVAFEEAFKAIISDDGNAIGKLLYLSDCNDRTGKTLVCSMAPIRGRSGDIVAVLCLSRFSEREPDRLSTSPTSEAMLSAILATVPDAMVVIDEYGNITSFSAAAQTLFGWSEMEVLGRKINILMPQPYASAHDRYLHRYLETGQKKIIGIGRVVEGQRRDGSVFQMELSIGEARTGNSRAFTGFIRDLTQRHETEARLQKVQSELIHASRLSAVGTLASALAHELNQPLTAIANYTSTGRDMVGDDRPQVLHMLREALDEAAKETARAGQIIRRLRDFVSKGELDTQILSLGKLINDAAALGLVGARDQGVTWEIILDPNIENVLADRVQIQQVMVNLIRNAIEAMDEAPTKELIVRARSHQPNLVEISVSDTGHGLSDEIAGQLFQPFVSSKPQGMGLGLSICRTIIEAHGGKLSVGSNPGGGTIFSFTLTLVEEDTQNDA